MNPPPLPPPPKNHKSFAHHAALGSLIMPILVVMVAVVTAILTRDSGSSRTVGYVLGCVGVPLIVAGFGLGIIGLCGIQRHGRRTILVQSVVGLALNGGLALFMATAVVMFLVKRAEGRRQATKDLHAATEELQTSVRESYDPKQGITNSDAGRLDRVQREMKNVSQKLTGDDALIMQVMGNHLNRMQSALKKYETAMAAFRDASVLRLENLTQKAQIEGRREIVRRFLTANAELKQVIADAEKRIRAELATTGLPAAKLEAVIKGFNSKAAPRNALTLKIRDCDQRLGDAALGALDLFESHWGSWRYTAAANKVIFEQTLASDAYNAFLGEMDAAAREQVELQGKLVKLP